MGNTPLYWLSLVPLFRHGVKPSAAERVTAQYPKERKPKSFKRTETLNRLDCVVRAGGIIFAARFFVRRNRLLIKPDKQNKRALHFKTPAFLSCSIIARRTSVLFTKGVLPLATKIKSYPGAIPGARERKASRMTRRERFRLTALPIFLLVVMPSRTFLLRFFKT